MTHNIFPFDEKLLPREQKEMLLQQRSKVIWFTGLSGSGKTTLALLLERELHKMKFLSTVLDGDNVRSGINNNLSFTSEDREENIRRIAEISKLFVRSGIITINGFVSPTDKLRNIARNIIGNEDFIEIFINTPIEVCEQRDVKGLYKKARDGQIKNFTGITAPFEEPKDAELVVHTVQQTPEETVHEILDFVKPLITY